MPRALKLTLGVLLIAAPGAATIYGAALFLAAIEKSSQISAEAYAQWGVANMIIRFMDDNEGSWPQSWGDLRSVQSERMGPWTMDQLEERVDVDFGADPVVLAAAKAAPGELPFKVVSLSSGNDYHYARAEPNRLIWEHLRAKLDKQRGPLPNSASVRADNP